MENPEETEQKTLSPSTIILYFCQLTKSYFITILLVSLTSVALPYFVVFTKTILNSNVK